MSHKRNLFGLLSSRNKKKDSYRPKYTARMRGFIESLTSL